MCNSEAGELRLCHYCRTKGRTSCEFLDDLNYVQGTIPEEITTRSDLRKVQRGMRTETLLRKSARNHECPNLNDQTLKLPKLPEE